MCHKNFYVTICMLLMLFVSSVAYAGFPDYYMGDRNRPLIWGHMGTGWFLDKTSLICIEYKPPCYTLEAKLLLVNNADRGNITISRKSTIRIFYNYDDMKMYVDKSNGLNDWRYLKPNGSNAESGLPMYAGEAMFYINYGMKFYGSRKWYDSFLKKNIDVFGDSFYSKL